MKNDQKSIVTMIQNKDLSDAKKAISEKLLSKADLTLDDRRAEVAKNMFAKKDR